MARWMVLGVALVIAGCGSDRSSADARMPPPSDGDTRSIDAAEPDGPVAPPIEPPPASGELSGLATGRTQWMLLCQRHHGDMISTKLCAGSEPPRITSIAELERLLGLTIDDIGGGPHMVMTGLSTGLGIRRTTFLNPRVVVMTHSNEDGRPNPMYEVLSFGRGELIVELVANDPIAKTLHFFALRFNPGCEFTAAGCNFADLLTPSVESGWRSYSIYDDEDLKNTTLDCRTCHQPRGPGTPRILRMQEFVAFWDHWFDGGQPGVQDFQAAHGSESYAGYPSAAGAGPGAGILYRSDPSILQRFLSNNGFGNQPNAFDSAAIESELASTGTSPTWQGIYDQAVAGLEIPPPYFGLLHTDPTKVTAMISAYQQVMAGTLPREQLPDIRDTLLDSALPYMSIRPKPGLDGRGILVHMCAMCHNSRLDQTSTRARFNVEQLDGMSREEKDRAIARLRLDDGDVRKMPPIRLHLLSAAERDLAIQELAR